MKYGDPGLKTLYLLEILMERTDEAHPVSVSALIRILEEDYQIGINRTTVYSELRKLEDAGVDVVRKEAQPFGYYVGSREFELAELKLLVDAVQSSKFITQKKSAQLIQKLETTERVKRNFNEDGISIPYPQVDVHIKDDDSGRM